MHIVKCHVVRRADVVRTGDCAAGVLQLDLVGTEAGQFIESELFARGSKCCNENDGGRADDHTQHGQQEAGFAGLEAVDREPDHLTEHHGGPRTGECAVKGGRFGKIRGRHRSND